MIAHIQSGGPRLPQLPHALLNCIAYGSAILVTLLAVTVAAAHLPRVASASQDETNNTVDVAKLERAIDAKALLRQDLPDDVYR